VFGIHPLTTEDILLEETREKIELFRNYYQDPYSQTYLEPLNMYIIVFREGTLSVSAIDTNPAAAADGSSSTLGAPLTRKTSGDASSISRTTSRSRLIGSAMRSSTTSPTRSARSSRASNTRWTASTSWC
jgi:hypothetical protein